MKLMNNRSTTDDAIDELKCHHEYVELTSIAKNSSHLSKSKPFDKFEQFKFWMRAFKSLGAKKLRGIHVEKEIFETARMNLIQLSRQLGGQYEINARMAVNHVLINHKLLSNNNAK